MSKDERKLKKRACNWIPPAWIEQLLKTNKQTKRNLKNINEHTVHTHQFPNDNHSAIIRYLCIIYTYLLYTYIKYICIYYMTFNYTTFLLFHSRILYIYCTRRKNEIYCLYIHIWIYVYVYVYIFIYIHITMRLYRNKKDVPMNKHVLLSLNFFFFLWIFCSFFTSKQLDLGLHDEVTVTLKEFFCHLYNFGNLLFCLWKILSWRIPFTRKKLGQVHLLYKPFD